LFVPLAFVGAYGVFIVSAILANFISRNFEIVDWSTKDGMVWCSIGVIFFLGVLKKILLKSISLERVEAQTLIEFVRNHLAYCWGGLL